MAAEAPLGSRCRRAPLLPVAAAPRTTASPAGPPGSGRAPSWPADPGRAAGPPRFT